MKKLLLIDANSLVHRAFHALPPLTSKGGEPVNALYGVSSIMLKFWKEDRPDYAAALFDRPEPTFRKEKYAEYKGHRKPAVDELIAQIISAHNLFPHFGAKVFEKPGFEADDLIATLATKFSPNGDLQITILTGDMDTLQLVNPNIRVCALKQGVTNTIVFDEATVRERYGLDPGQMIDYKAMVGDPSDNIKGISGIGPKTAVELLQKWGDLDNIYAHIDELKQKNKLALARETAQFSKELVILRKDVEMPIEDIEELAVPKDFEEVRWYFSEMGFEALLKRIDQPVEKPEPPKPKQGKIF